MSAALLPIWAFCSAVYFLYGPLARGLPDWSLGCVTEDFISSITAFTLQFVAAIEEHGIFLERGPWGSGSVSFLKYWRIVDILKLMRHMYLREGRGRIISQKFRGKIIRGSEANHEIREIFGPRKFSAIRYLSHCTTGLSECPTYIPHIQLHTLCTCYTTVPQDYRNVLCMSHVSHCTLFTCVLPIPLYHRIIGLSYVCPTYPTAHSMYQCTTGLSECVPRIPLHTLCTCVLPIPLYHRISGMSYVFPRISLHTLCTCVLPVPLYHRISGMSYICPTAHFMYLCTTYPLYHRIIGMSYVCPTYPTANSMYLLYYLSHCTTGLSECPMYVPRIPLHTLCTCVLPIPLYHRISGMSYVCPTAHFMYMCTTYPTVPQDFRNVSCMSHAPHFTLYVLICTIKMYLSHQPYNWMSACSLFTHHSWFMNKSV